MGDPVLVSGMDGVGQGLDEPGGSARVLGFPAALSESAAVEVLQQEERPAVVFAEFVDLDDIRVLQPGQG